ncbi:MAG: GNAT family N-acetyltransferase, partial [Betaproteobacteria bacterium]|nr:GNAT family N-acetyltransferase [Betaproteobacteria bacterium]
SHRNLRFRTEVGKASAPGDAEEVAPLGTLPFDELASYDRRCFPAPRTNFLKRWIAQPDALALGLRRGGRLSGYGVVRRCREGCKIGPLFADDRAAANALYLRLAGFAAGGPLFLDAPENNPEAMALVQAQRMTEVFGCARMYLGPKPAVAEARVFGVTTFELG